MQWRGIEMRFKKLISLLLVCILFMLSACSSVQTDTESTTTSNIETTIQGTTELENVTTTTELQSSSAQSTTDNSTTTTEQSTTKKAVSNKTTSTTSTTSSTHLATSTIGATTVIQSKPTTATQTTAVQKPTTALTTTTTKATTIATTKPATTIATTTQSTTEKPYCVLTIECKEILNNMDDLKAGHENYVPANGYILSSYKVRYSNGDTAYDILKRGCEENNIKLTATTTVYGTYVSGINNLDEFDCGKQSGWLYSVNSTFPRVSCSKQSVNPNDIIIFKYTCTY